VLVTWKKAAMIVIPAVALGLVAAGAAQAVNLVTNGSFENTTNGPNLEFDLYTQAPGWTSTGNSYNFIYAPGAADTVGAIGQDGNVQLWGPNNGSNNGLPASSPDGGNYVAADGAFQQGAIQQTISGLTVGASYEVSFYWAGAQQSGFTGPTTEQWQVSFGSQTQSTAIVNNESHGFTGWMQQAFTFTAGSASQVLSFLAVGTPNGVPPFSLLDGVAVNAVPEPTTLALLVIGSLGFVALRLRRRTKSDAS
jgi:hypothetical protein